MLLAVAATMGLGWWQLSRWESASGGVQNLGYALQWPLFGVFTIVMWRRLIRDSDPSRARPQTAAQPRPPRVSINAELVESDDPADRELAVYNAYLASLDQQPRR